MFRLILKVHEVHLRLKQEVDVQIVIKKGTQNFAIPKKVKLSQGKAIINAHSEFFISSKDPVFDLFVMIIHGSNKRFAGMCSIDLNDWSEGSSNTTTSILQKSPDAQAKILFDFLFLTTDFTESSKGLMNLIQLESEKKVGFMKDFEQRNTFLTHENNRLTQELEALKKANFDLNANQNLMAQQHSKRSNAFDNTFKEKCGQMQFSQNSLNMMKQKMARLEEIVNNSGQADVKSKMKDLQNEYLNSQMN